MVTKICLSLIKKHKALYISIVAIIALGVSLLSGMAGFCKSLGSSLYSYIEDYGYPDAYITTRPIGTNRAKLLNDIEGVESVSTRIFTDVIVNTEDGKTLLMRGFSFSSDDIENFSVWEEIEDTGRYDAVLLEVEYARENGIKPGDILRTDVGNRNITCMVKALVSTPETLAGDYGGLTGISPETGYVYFDTDLLKFTVVSKKANQFLINVKEGYDPEKVLSLAVERFGEEGIGVKESVSYDELNVVKRIRESIIAPIKTMTGIIPTAFYIISLCVISLCISILVKQYSRETGILKAIGIEDKKIREGFFMFSLSAFFAGIVLSIVPAVILIRVCTQYYGDYLLLPKVVMMADVPVYVNAAVISLVMVVVSTYICTSSVKRLNPASAMKGKAGETECKDSPFIKGATTKSRWIPIKYNLALTLRNRKRLVFDVLLLSFTAAIFLPSLSFSASNRALFKDMFEKRLHYDCLVFFDEKNEEEGLKMLQECEYAQNAEKVITFYGELTRNGRKARVPVSALDFNGSLVSLNTEGPSNSDEIVLDSFYAKLLGAKEGDTVNLGGYPLKVIGITKQYTAKMSYIPFDSPALEDADSVTSFAVKSSETELLHERLKDTEGFLQISFMDVCKKDLQKDLKTNEFVATAVIVFAVIIGFVMAVTTFANELEERKRELCVIRALGISMRKISLGFLGELAVKFLLSLLPGMLLGTAVGIYTMNSISGELRSYPYASGVREYAMTALLVFVYMIFGELTAMLILKRKNIAANISEKE